jgi:sugar phosphate isomerase/epimerase
MPELEIGVCWGTLRQANLVEIIDAAGRHGFPTLSVRPDMFLDALEQGFDEKALRLRMRDAGVRVQVIDAISAGLPGGRTPEPTHPGEVVASSAETCMRTAEALKAPVVNLCHYTYFDGGPVMLSEMIDTAGAISREAAARGLRIVMEFVPNTGIPSIGDALAIARGVAMTNCGVLLDPWHLARSGGTVDDIRRLPTGLIGGFQLDDRKPPAPGEPYLPMTGRELPGEGELPLWELTHAALMNNPALTAEVEVFSAELRNLSIDAAAARVRAAVDKWRAGL